MNRKKGRQKFGKKDRQKFGSKECSIGVWIDKIINRYKECQIEGQIEGQVDKVINLVKLVEYFLISCHEGGHYGLPLNSINNHSYLHFLVKIRKSFPKI